MGTTVPTVSLRGKGKIVGSGVAKKVNAHFIAVFLFLGWDTGISPVCPGSRALA